MGNETSTDDNKMNYDYDINKKCQFKQFKSQNKLSKEMKIKCKGMPDSLFVAQKGNEDGSEKILASDKVDRRIEAPSNAFDDNHENHIYNIVLLRMVFNGTTFVGSGTIIHRALDSLYILTAAHNVIQYNKDLKQSIEAEGIEFAINQNTKWCWNELECYPAFGWYIHPEYINNPTSTSGNDIAIIKVIIDVNDKILKNIKPVKIHEYGSDITSYSGAKVIGFPAEKHGELWGMSGDYNLENKNTLITYKEIDTSGGQSGAPIFYEGKTNDDNNDIFTRFNKIVGVHTGGKIDMGKNWGTALNDEKLKWIAETLGHESFLQPNYQANALLISTNPIYNEYLDKMYQTFNRSQVINSKRLYFNNNDGIIDKLHILAEIKRIFQDKQEFADSEHCTLLCFCGESDQNGDWIINKKNKNKIQCVTFNDIKLIQKEIAGKLFIISDCSYSQKWIIEDNKIPESYWDTKKIFIQASAHENEIADPGVFMSKYSYSCLRWFQNEANVGLPRALGAGIGMVLSVPVSLVWDSGIKQVYHSSKMSTPICSIKYVDRNAMEIGETNDEYYKITFVMTSSWADLDRNETYGAAAKYGSFGYMGGC